MSFSDYSFVQAAKTPKTKLIVVDPSVEDYEILLTRTPQDSYVAVLNPLQDGVAEITALLRSLPAVRGVHIISHGAPGTLYLGNSELSLDTLEGYGEAVQSWFKATSPDLCLYGCRVEGEAGQGGSAVDGGA